MTNQNYRSTEDAIKDLTNLLRPLGRLTILEPSNLSLAKNIFKKLKSTKISPTKEEIKPLAIQFGWDSKQADKLTKKFGV